MGTVHVVATPIGNLEDITLRALRVLSEADLLFAEDTRRTAILLQRHQIAARALSLHAHNEASRIDQALQALATGGRVALVSDAGTPLISDPGERLVAAALAAGHEVESVPGASAVLAALTVSGLPPAPFAFLGFLPRRPGRRRKVLESYLGRPETLVLFEAPTRVVETLQALADVLGPRRACAARELTKLHEEVLRGTPSELAEQLVDRARGEFTVVVEGARDSERQETGDTDVEDEIRAGIASGESPRQIAARLAPRTGIPRRALYARAVAAREDS